MDQQTIILREGRQGGPYEGRIFATVRPASRMARLILREIGAEQRGTAFLLPAGAGEQEMDRLREASAADLRALTGQDRDAWEAGCAIIEVRQLLASGRSGARDAARKRLAGLSQEQRRIMSGQLRPVATEVAALPVAA